MSEVMELDDAILEDELRRNRRVVTHPKLGKVELRRPNPADERDIAEAKRKSYHLDIQDPNVLSKKQIEKILEERGVWTPKDTEEMQRISDQSTNLMAQIAALGFRDPSDLFEELLKLNDELLKSFGIEGLSEADLDKEQKKIYEHLSTFFDVENLGRSEASLYLRKKAPNSTVVELLGKAETAMFISDLISEFGKLKLELNAKLRDFTTFFGESAEARADRAERLAKIYYCVRKPGTGDILWESLEDLWHEDPDVVTWMSTQLFYFENGVTAESAEVLETFGFMERVSDTEDSSEGSPDQETPNSDGESVESEPETSSE